MRKIILHRHQENKYLKLEERIKTVSPLRIGISKNTGLSFVATKKWLWSMIPSKTNSSRNNLFYEFFYNTSSYIFFLPLMPPVFSLAPLPLAFLKLYASDYLFFFSYPSIHLHNSPLLVSSLITTQVLTHSQT